MLVAMTTHQLYTFHNPSYRCSKLEIIVQVSDLTCNGKESVTQEINSAGDTSLLT